jgi:hypothetical protein
LRLHGVYHVAERFAVFLVNNLAQQASFRGRTESATIPHTTAAMKISGPFSSETPIEVYQQYKFIIAHLAKNTWNRLGKREFQEPGFHVV